MKSSRAGVRVQANHSPADPGRCRGTGTEAAEVRRLCNAGHTPAATGCRRREAIRRRRLAVGGEMCKRRRCQAKPRPASEVTGDSESKSRCPRPPRGPKVPGPTRMPPGTAAAARAAAQARSSARARAGPDRPRVAVTAQRPTLSRRPGRRRSESRRPPRLSTVKRHLTRTHDQ
jgi:hypothetical protein